MLGECNTISLGIHYLAWGFHWLHPRSRAQTGALGILYQMNQQAEIGSRLKQIREHLEETQTVFGERFNCSRDDIANYERGLCDIPNSVLAGLDRMEYSLTWLLNGQGDLQH